MADESNQTTPQNVNRGCHFTSLPAELQNIIYELALIMPDERDLSGKKRDCSIFLSNSAISLECTPFGRIETRIPCSCTVEDESIDYPCPMHVSKLIFKKRLAPSLLRVCKKMRRECTPILYGCNSFKMDTPTLQHFLCQIGPVDKSYLTRLCIVDFFAPIGICANPYHYPGIWPSWRSESMYMGIQGIYCTGFGPWPSYHDLADVTNLVTLELPIRPHWSYGATDVMAVFFEAVLPFLVSRGWWGEEGMGTYHDAVTFPLRPWSLEHFCTDEERTEYPKFRDSLITAIGKLLSESSRGSYHWCHHRKN